LIVYFDTSSLIKLYVEEEGSSAVRDLIASVELAASSNVLPVELRGALARMLRSSRLDAAGRDTARADFDEDWSRMAEVAATGVVLERAAELAERHFLKALDAIHLASALTLSRQEEGELVLSSWDGSLLDAAVAEGVRVISLP
jgi:predicted nucleic acid-binding protein